MQPVQDLLNRIRWDEEFSKADFTIAYYDRVEGCLIYVPFKEIQFDAADHFAFQVVDDDGVSHTIPLHRVKTVCRNGKEIWHRDY